VIWDLEGVFGTLALRDRLRKGAAKYLEPGEQVQAAFLATRLSVKSHHYAVVATDRRILLLALDWTGLRTTRLLGEVPRTTRLGPCSGLLHPLPVFGNDLAVNSRFFKDVEEIDRAAESPRSHPPVP
jgi:hypothetical protein